MTSRKFVTRDEHLLGSLETLLGILGGWVLEKDEHTNKREHQGNHSFKRIVSCQTSTRNHFLAAFRLGFRVENNQNKCAVYFV